MRARFFSAWRGSGVKRSEIQSRATWYYIGVRVGAKGAFFNLVSGVVRVPKGVYSPELYNTAEIVRSTGAYTELIDKYKSMAAARRKAVKYKQEFAAGMYERINNYFAACEEKHEPAAVAGIILAAGVNSEAFYRMKAGDYDYMLESFLDMNQIKEGDIYEQDGAPWCDLVEEETGEVVRVLLFPFSTILEKSLLRLQLERERRAAYTKGNPAGNIFLLKAQHGFDDTGETARSVTNNNLTIKVASISEAKDALKRLSE